MRARGSTARQGGGGRRQRGQSSAGSGGGRPNEDRQGPPWQPPTAHKTATAAQDPVSRGPPRPRTQQLAVGGAPVACGARAQGGAGVQAAASGAHGRQKQKEGSRRECSAPCRARAVADGTARHNGVRRSARLASLTRHVRRPGVAVAKCSARPARAARVRAPTPSAAPRACAARATRNGTTVQLLPPSAVITAVQCEAASVFVGVMITTMRRVHTASTQSTSDLPASHGAM